MQTFRLYAATTTVVALSAISAFAQDNQNSQVAASLEAAKQISTATGRPIFAIAGRST